MKSVRKVLFLLLSTAALAVNAVDDLRSRFLYTYYSGDFLKAHQALSSSFSDSVVRQIWEERIHHHATVDNCNYMESSTPGTRGFALLKAGAVEEAEKILENDWLSLLTRSTLALWRNDSAAARQHVLEAIKLAPERPEVYYLAGNVSRTTDESTMHFLKFLTLVKEDPYRKQVVEYSIEFMNRTRGMELNVVSKFDGYEELETLHRAGQLIVRANINDRKKVLLMVDTGSGGLTLKEKNWQTQVKTDLLMFGIGKDPVTKGSRVVFTDFQAGRFSMKNPVAAISQEFPTDGFDGIVGTSFFSNGKNILAPMKNGQKFALFNENSDPLSLLQSRGMKFKEQHQVPFLDVGKMIIIKGSIRNSPPDMNFMLDTGAERTMISTLAAKKYTRINFMLSLDANKNSPLVGVGGRADNLLVVENVDIAAGPIKKTFNRMPALNLAEGSESLELEIDGILGRDSLQGYALAIDYKNRTLTFLR